MIHNHRDNDNTGLQKKKKILHNRSEYLYVFRCAELESNVSLPWLRRFQGHLKFKSPKICPKNSEKNHGHL